MRAPRHGERRAGASVGASVGAFLLDGAILIEPKA